MEYYQGATPAHIARFSPCAMILFGLWSMSSAIGQPQQPEFAHAFQKRNRIERLRIDLHLAGLDLGDVEQDR